ncbi:CHL4-domain-containing protein [Ascodesmis nigricans]|uniref:CHL4-domain-containing protein n=1 Tax=Ascodesmis nigricans TaxID=341454 RepID=A0A4S2N5U7_9PEZI|nr:CHL4-domain-containing protein [Ascodesmis nigricans]
MPKQKDPYAAAITTLAAAALPHTTVIPFSPEVSRQLSRLSKPALLRLIGSWLSDERVHQFAPDFHDPDDDGVDVGKEEEDARDVISVEEAREVYRDMGEKKEMRAKDVVLRMKEYEWRYGMTLLAIAEVDWVYLLTHPTSSKWTALAIKPLTTSSSNSTPHFHAPLFTTTLTSALHPLHIPHLTIFSHPTLPLTLLRISLHPLATPPSFPSARHNFWLSFPSSANTHIFTTLGLRKGDAAREAVMSGISAGLGREGQRWEVGMEGFVVRTLGSMCWWRGTEGGSGGCAAGWEVYTDGFENNPLALPKEISMSALNSSGVTEGRGRKDHDNPTDDDGSNNRAIKRRKLLASTRFGATTSINDNRAIESVIFRLEEPFPSTLLSTLPPLQTFPTDSSSESDDDDEYSSGGVWRPDVTITFEGPHVFAGLKSMAETGKGVDVEKCPGWMVGEAAVTSAVIRGGKVVKNSRIDKGGRVEVEARRKSNGREKSGG